MNHKAELKKLTDFLIWFENKFDDIMKESESVARGGELAKLMNALSCKNQSVMHYSLGYSFNKIDKLYKKKGA